MLDHEPLVGKSTESRNRGEAPSAIMFTPERILAAITYHLVDEGIATSVAPESTKRTLNRLRQQSFSFSISARLWSRMTNLERLKRLLEESRTEPSILGGGTASLAQRAR